MDAKPGKNTAKFRFEKIHLSELDWIYLNNLMDNDCEGILLVNNVYKVKWTEYKADGSFWAMLEILNGSP